MYKGEHITKGAMQCNPSIYEEDEEEPLLLDDASEVVAAPAAPPAPPAWFLMGAK